MTDNEKKEAIIHRAGQELASRMPDFYGKVSFNLQGGKYVSSNVEESLKPEKNSSFVKKT